MDISQFNFLQFTEAELSQSAALQNIFFRQGELVISLAEQLAAAEPEAEAEIRAKIARAARQRTKAQAELIEINNAAAERYFKTVPTEQAILDDARKVLAAATKEEYEAFENPFATEAQNLIDQLELCKDKLSEAELKRLKYIKQASKAPEQPKHDYAGYFVYLLSCTRLQLNALKYHKLRNAPLTDLIREQAAGAYEPPKEQAEQQKLEAIKTSRTDNLISLNSPQVNFLFNYERQENALKLYREQANGQISFADVDILTGKKGTKEVTAQISVWYDESAFTYTRNDKPVLLNDFDASILDAIVTLIENGTRAFTLPMLYATMTQQEIHKIKINKTIERKLRTGLNRLEGTKVKINAGITDEIQINGNTVKKTYDKESVLSLGEKGYIINGQEVEAIYLKELPPLYVDAKARNKLLTTPRQALALDIGERNTTEIIALKRYLRAEIARINNPGQSRHIKYDTLYSRMSNVKGQELDKKQKLSIRQSTIKILNKFVQAELIAAFKEVKQGKAYHHIEIVPIKTKPKK